MADELKRIDPKTIRGLFEKHNMTPMQHGFCCMKDAQPCVCINTMLAVENSDEEEDSVLRLAEGLVTYTDNSELLHLSHLDGQYALGLAQGWDGRLIIGRIRTKREQTGVEDGRAAWESCRPLTWKEAPNGSD